MNDDGHREVPVFFFVSSWDMGEKVMINEVNRAVPGSMRLIDIRKKPDEHQIPGSERYSGEALANAEALPFNKSEKVVIYCGSGNSCSVLADELRAKGYDTAALEGGYAAWKDADFPVEDISKLRDV